jgi:hypothetical protein
MPETCVVRSGDGWLDVVLPAGLDPLWSVADRWIYAAAYAAAVARGFTDSRAVMIAEAIVCKRLYGDLVYDKILEQEIRQVYV